MNYKLYLSLSIIFLLTACGEVKKNSDTPQDSFAIKDSNSSKVICEEMQNSYKLITKNYGDTPKIEPMDSLNLLVQKESNETVAFDGEGLYQLFTTQYYWASLVSRSFDYEAYAEPQKLIDALRYEKDRWSFATTVKEYNSVTSQKSVGVGVACKDVDLGCLITYVRIDSPADKIDLRRGDIVTKIDGAVATEALFYKKAKEEQKINLELIRNSSNQQCQGAITPHEYQYKVVDKKILQTSTAQKVAYLRVDSFLGEERIEEQISSAFDSFKLENIEKLIIDLRYNGGGSVDLASQLLNRLSMTHIGEEQFTLAWNSNYQSRNQTYRFNTSSNGLNLKQILFLTTEHTASASELIISAMRPYMSEDNLVVIGNRTHGKPVGMSVQKDSDYYYFLINFVVKNSVGYYDYFDGLPVTKGCEVDDDAFHEMGDPQEAMLKTALHYIDNGSCQ